MIGKLKFNSRDYESARRTYQYAMKYAKDNSQILKDLIMTQLQLREFPQAVESCRSLLQLKPLALHWFLFAASSFLVFSVLIIEQKIGRAHV